MGVYYKHSNHYIQYDKPQPLQREDRSPGTGDSPQQDVAEAGCEPNTAESWLCSETAWHQQLTPLPALHLPLSLRFRLAQCGSSGVGVGTGCSLPRDPLHLCSRAGPATGAWSIPRSPASAHSSSTQGHCSLLLACCKLGHPWGSHVQPSPASPGEGLCSLLLSASIWRGLGYKGPVAERCKRLELPQRAATPPPPGEESVDSWLGGSQLLTGTGGVGQSRQGNQCAAEAPLPGGPFPSCPLGAKETGWAPALGLDLELHTHSFTLALSKAEHEQGAAESLSPQNGPTSSA